MKVTLSESDSHRKTVIRINWDKYEAALLIDTFWRIEKDSQKKKELIEELSSTLRARAKNLGIEIDDTFRNTNGISMQLTPIAHAFFPERPSLTTSAVFDEMVSLYKEDRAGFDAVLNDAKIQVQGGSQVKIPHNNRLTFISWLSSNCPHDISIERVTKTIEFASKHCTSLGITSKSIWEINELSDFITASNILLNKKLFRIINRRLIPDLEKSFSLYKAFLSFRLDSKNVDGVKEHKDVEPLTNASTIMQPDFCDIEAVCAALETSPNQTEHTEKHILAIPSPSMEDATFLPDKLYKALKKENTRNKYGTTLSFLADQVGSTEKSAKTILDQAEWAIFRYGRYYFNDNSQQDENQYSFETPQSLAFTKPIKLLYFDDVVSTGSTWRKLYIDFLHTLYEDYPDQLKNISGIVYPPATAPLVGNKNDLPKIRVPSEFAPGLYVELNQSANDLVSNISKLLEICNVDYENVVIFYSHKKTDEGESRGENGKNDKNLEQVAKSVTTPKESFQEDNERRYYRQDKEDFYRWLLNEQKLAKPTCSGYVSAIIVAEEWAQKNLSSACKLYSANQDVISFTASALFNDVAFQKRNEQQHNRYFAAIRKFLEYSRIEALEQNSEVVTEPVTKRVAFDEAIPQTLSQHYSYGFNINSPIELVRFRKYYLADQERDCELEDDALRAAIKTCGFEFRGKIYVISEGAKKHIKEIIDSNVQNGSIIFYYDELYEKNEGWLYDELILDSEMLKAIIESLYPAYQFKDRYFIVRVKKTTELTALKEEIMHIWGDEVLRTFSELDDLLPYIPIDKIKYALSYGERFTWNSLETYARNDLFEITEAQVNEIITCAEEKCAENGSVSFDELSLDDIAADNYELSETALFEIVFSYLPSSFSRNGKIITKARDRQDTTSALVNYCRAYETCTMQELQDLMRDVEGVIRYPVIIEAANSAMVRISYDDFVADNHVQFDVPSIDQVLDTMVIGNGIGMKEITTFGAFPFCGYPWNLFVLESYCRRFSSKYKYDCITPNSRNGGAIIKKACNLSFHDIMVESVARSKVNLNKKDVYDYLIDSGLMIRRQYNDIERLINEAKALREGRN